MRKPILQLLLYLLAPVVLAVCALLPAPLVTFVVLVGYVAGGVAGAVVMTLGMFLPALALGPIVEHLQLYAHGVPR